MRTWIIGATIGGVLGLVSLYKAATWQPNATPPAMTFDSAKWIRAQDLDSLNNPRYAMRNGAIAAASRCSNQSEVERLLGNPNRVLEQSESVQEELEAAHISVGQGTSKVVLCYDVGQQFEMPEATYWRYDIDIFLVDGHVRDAWVTQK